MAAGMARLLSNHHGMMRMTAANQFGAPIKGCQRALEASAVEAKGAKDCIARLNRIGERCE